MRKSDIEFMREMVSDSGVKKFCSGSDRLSVRVWGGRPNWCKTIGCKEGMIVRPV